MKAGKAPHGFSLIGLVTLAVILCSCGAWAKEAPLMYTEPYLLAPTTNSIYVCWITSEETTRSYVEYGPTGSYGYTRSAKTYELEGLKTVDENGEYTVPLKAYQQIVHIMNLEPGTRYYYRVVSETGSRRKVSRGYYFKTAPRPGTPVKFILLSDLQLKAQAPATLKLAGQQEADFIIYNGDLVNTPYKAGEWFSVPETPEEDGLRWFNMMQQTGDGCKLLQYIPIYPSPGNHEIDAQEQLMDKRLADRDRMSMSIYMQLFRPLYPEQEYRANGKHWYSMDYGDLHIVSLSVFRWFAWKPEEAPGWFLFDDIKAGSPQYNWLRADLESKKAKYTWVTMHWHMFNRGTDVQVPFTDPTPSVNEPGRMKYPGEKDYLQRDIKPLFENYGVNAVSYGHSHVYERYIINGVHYIEAATIGNNYRSPDDPYEPHGNRPVVEENRFRSFMLVSIDPATGMTAQGIQASVEKDGFGTVGRVFDGFTIAQ